MVGTSRLLEMRASFLVRSTISARVFQLYVTSNVKSFQPQFFNARPIVMLTPLDCWPLTSLAHGACSSALRATSVVIAEETRHPGEPGS